MIQKVIEIVSREACVPAEELSAASNLDELGIDSLEFVELMIAIREEIKDIPESKWASLNTIQDIVEALA